MRFAARWLDGEGGFCHILGAASFIDAALAFAEGAAVPLDSDFTVLVIECESGETRCFEIDVGASLVRAC